MWLWLDYIEAPKKEAIVQEERLTNKDRPLLHCQSDSSSLNGLDPRSFQPKQLHASLEIYIKDLVK